MDLEGKKIAVNTRSNPSTRTGSKADRVAGPAVTAPCRPGGDPTRAAKQQYREDGTAALRRRTQPHPDGVGR